MASKVPTQILLVEDNDDDAFLFKRASGAWGMSPTFCGTSDADQAMSTLATASAGELPDLVVLDLKLAGLDGFDVLAWIRSQPLLQGLPVVIFSPPIWRETGRRLSNVKPAATSLSLSPLRITI